MRQLPGGQMRLVQGACTVVICLVIPEILLALKIPEHRMLKRGSGSQWPRIGIHGYDDFRPVLSGH